MGLPVATRHPLKRCEPMMLRRIASRRSKQWRMVWLGIAIAAF
ncbi:hypothetical protein USDA257_c45660 [Sinorhizobium fredii USDA 257]|uniref:Uncharacterized protein n=1 Tax=Sinorhizobium fredii (strain USDA 257) TaxID=1185652 RepID=I3XB48_SINF2|nr:hypothetical protein USDA257_c45660 [Sinorhizobium fredii USDA 257]